MQLYNGALSYWEGGYEESWWGTIYAAHFLYEAQKAGFEINAQSLEKMYQYLSSRLKDKSTSKYQYYDNTGNKIVKDIVPKEVAYSLYVLAIGGHQDISSMNYYKSNSKDLALDSRYLLACTYLHVGDNFSYRSLLPRGFDQEKSIDATGGSFYSYLRDMALALNVMVDTDPANSQVGILAKHVSTQLKKDKYISTQEAAFAMLALGKISKKANSSNITATINVDGKKLQTYTDGVLILDKNIASRNINIVANGNGSLYYFWEIEGLSNTGIVKEEDSFLRVRKQFYDRSGNELGRSEFRQNELIIVKLSLSTTDNSNVDNVVITDMLPAGFEIENPKLSESAEIRWIKDKNEAEHMDVRDDRINLFVDAGPKTKNYYYMVRAVSPGRFKMGPVSADAMYNGEYHSYNGARNIRVSKAIEETP